jgi:intracellular multiplication protein IcmT
MKPARFFMLDARAAWPIFLMLLHMRFYTMLFSVFTMLVFYLLEQRGLSFFAALRAFRVWIVTRKRPNHRHSDMTRMVDFAFEPLPQKFIDEVPEVKNESQPAASESPAGRASRATVPPVAKSK